MTEKGFAKAKDVEKISKEEIEALAREDGMAAVIAAKNKRENKAYKDEFTEGTDAIDVPEELDEPEVPENKTVAKKPKETEADAEETAKAIYSEGYKAGYLEGHKKARAEFLERLVG